jgi:hypothetical protein
MKKEVGEDSEGRVVAMSADNDTVYVVRGDGSLWALDVMDIHAGVEWKRLPDLP